MRLQEYIEAVDGSRAKFAKRAGLLEDTVARIARGESRCRIDIAKQIILTTIDRPAPGGGVVTWDDLIPDERQRA